MDDDEVVAIEEEEPETTDETGEEGSENENTDGEQSTGKQKLYTQEEVEAAIKRRVATFNKKIDKLKPKEATIQRLCEMTGLDEATLVTRLEGLSDAEQAKILGVTPQQISTRRQETQRSRETSESTKKLQREYEEKTLMLDPKYQDLPLFREEIEDLMEDNPKLSVKQAYVLAKGEVGTKAAVRDAEQRTIAKMTKSSNQQVLKPGPVSSSSAPKIDSATIAAAKAIGMDPAEYLAFSKMSNLDDYDRYKGAKKK